MEPTSTTYLCSHEGVSLLQLGEGIFTSYHHDCTPSANDESNNIFNIIAVYVGDILIYCTSLEWIS
jgi:hypothetical protein